MSKGRPPRSTNQLWRAQFQAKSLAREIQVLGKALVEQQGPPALIEELREAYREAHALSERLIEAYGEYGGSV